MNRLELFVKRHKIQYGLTFLFLQTSPVIEWLIIKRKTKKRIVHEQRHLWLILLFLQVNLRSCKDLRLSRTSNVPWRHVLFNLSLWGFQLGVNSAKWLQPWSLLTVQEVSWGATSSSRQAKSVHLHPALTTPTHSLWIWRRGLEEWHGRGSEDRRVVD